jgi:HTH-type transcriptional regulator/antitoxin HigA
MANLKYTVVKSDSQYYKYCDILDELVQSGLNSSDAINEYELLYLLISDWDNKHSLGPDLDPVELIKALMEEHNLNQTKLADIADIGKSYMSQILHYKKRMSKKVIRNIANYFKINQENLNRPYSLDERAIAN